MTTIREMAIKYAPHPTDKDWNKMQEQLKKLSNFEAGANAVLEEIESLIENTSGESEVYHYNLYIGLQKLVKELKGE